jgi:hypothetical protein
MASDVFITSYNPEVGQTDSTPCIAGGTGYDICQLARRGIRPIALSQEMASWSMIANTRGLTFKPGDLITLKSTDFPGDPRCNGDFVVADAMNIRFRKRADIFMSSRKDNISCTAQIYFSGENLHPIL